MLGLVRKPHQPRCSFCGKEKSSTRHMVAGPGVFICDQCVELCWEVIAEEKAKLPT